jgi:hypothetical protein
MNHLLYGGYPEGDPADIADCRGKQTRPLADEGPSRDKAPGAAARKRKLGTTTEDLGLRASDHFVGDLLETCAAPGEPMSSPELRETSARMLKVTGGRWPRNVPIPRAAVEDFFTSRLARDLRKERWCCCISSDGERPPGRAAEETSGPRQVGRPEAGGEGGAAQREVRRLRCRYVPARHWSKAPLATTHC